MARRRAALVIVGMLAALPVASGCTVPGAIGLGPCVRADEATVSAVKDAARTHFVAGESRIDHKEFVRASMAEIPASERRFGMTHVLAVYGSEWFENPVSADMSGVYRTDYFAVKAKSRRIYPLTDLAEAGYSFEPPDASGWQSWAAAVRDSHAASVAGSCANP